MRFFQCLFGIALIVGLNQSSHALELNGEPGFSLFNDSVYDLKIELNNGAAVFYKTLKPGEYYVQRIDVDLETKILLNAGLGPGRIKAIFEPGKTIYIAYRQPPETAKIAKEILGIFVMMDLRDNSPSPAPKLVPQKGGLFNKTSQGYSLKFNVTSLDIEKAVMKATMGPLLDEALRK